MAGMTPLSFNGLQPRRRRNSGSEIKEDELEHISHTVVLVATESDGSGSWSFQRKFDPHVGKDGSFVLKTQGTQAGEVSGGYYYIQEKLEGLLPSPFIINEDDLHEMESPLLGMLIDEYNKRTQNYCKELNLQTLSAKSIVNSECFDKKLTFNEFVTNNSLEEKLPDSLVDYLSDTYKQKYLLNTSEEYARSTLLSELGITEESFKSHISDLATRIAEAKSLKSKDKVLAALSDWELVKKAIINDFKERPKSSVSIIIHSWHSKTGEKQSKDKEEYKIEINTRKASNPFLIPWEISISRQKPNQFNMTSSSYSVLISKWIYKILGGTLPPSAKAMLNPGEVIWNHPFWEKSRTIDEYLNKSNGN